MLLAEKGFILVGTVCAVCCRIAVISALAVSTKVCGDMVLLENCARSLVIVGVILVTFLARALVKASLVTGSFKRLEW